MGERGRGERRAEGVKWGRRDGRGGVGEDMECVTNAHAFRM